MDERALAGSTYRDDRGNANAVVPALIEPGDVLVAADDFFGVGNGQTAVIGRSL